LKRYLAGYLDGEGCIRWQGNRAYVSITNTYPHVLHLLVRRFKGSVRQIKNNNRKHRTVYRWEVRGRHAVRFLRMVRPYLIEKKRQAIIVIELDSIGVEYDSSYVRHLIRELAMLKRIDYAKEDGSPD
jgi:hypothetical protein